MRTRFEECDRECYYCFHRNYGHDTKEFYDLKNQIENLIYRDHLDRYVRKPCEPSLRPKGPVERQIDIIVGGLATRGDNSSARKAYTRGEVQKRPKAQHNPKITFKSENEYPTHDDALMISAHIANACVKRIMIDTRSSTDIPYFDAFQKLGMINRDLITMTSTLTGFTGDVIAPVSVATLPVTFGGEPRPSWFPSWT
ncbi:hypothetical protein B296_00023737 [Ensete ventricosum]|uniref:Uncharacterized protein n=1 Tax=Ensete ventricosum TaxID=4639 RepID=A0A426YQ44_ENSVE|nr:hypothetical protein B296_00023737 [Ensete ventricosum]